MLNFIYYIIWCGAFTLTYTLVVGLIELLIGVPLYFIDKKVEKNPTAAKVALGMAYVYGAVQALIIGIIYGFILGGTTITYFVDHRHASPKWLYYILSFLSAPGIAAKAESMRGILILSSYIGLIGSYIFFSFFRY